MKSWPFHLLEFTTYVRRIVRIELFTDRAAAGEASSFSLGSWSNTARAGIMNRFPASEKRLLFHPGVEVITT